MARQTRELRLLEIETARFRHIWVKNQINAHGSTPELLKYLRQSLKELRALRARRGRTNLELAAIQ